MSGSVAQPSGSFPRSIFGRTKLRKILRLLSLRLPFPMGPERPPEVAGETQGRNELMASADSPLMSATETVGEHLIAWLDLLECRLTAKLEEMERRFIMATSGSALLGVALAFIAALAL